MAAECTETSIIVNPNPNSSTQNWWQEIMHANTLYNNSNLFPWQYPNSTNNNNSSAESSAGEDDVSISNQSVLTAESSRRQLVVDGGAAVELIGETSSDHGQHLWSHFLLSGGSTSTRGGIMEYKSHHHHHHHHPQQIGEAMLNLSSSSPSSSTTTNNNNTNNNNMISNSDDHHHEYFRKMSNPAAYEFSLTPPPPIFAGGHTCGTRLHECNDNNSNSNSNIIINNSFDINNNNNNDFSASFQSYLSKPLLLDINHEYKPTTALKTLQYLSSSASAAAGGGGYTTQRRGGGGLHSSPVQSRASICSTLSRSNGRGHVGSLGNNNEGKKKKLEDNHNNNNSEKGISKRHKNDNNSSPSKQIQVPKVKLADKITALQQIVSPFGKTDTASVLWEAIGHIRFLQEQIQLLTSAYVKSNTRKEIPWGGLIMDSRKDGVGEAKMVDLRSKGLCLVPISSTPRLYRESSASDYLIPTYRGCLYG